MSVTIAADEEQQVRETIAGSLAGLLAGVERSDIINVVLMPAGQARSTMIEFDTLTFTVGANNRQRLGEIVGAVEQLQTTVS